MPYAVCRATEHQQCRGPYSSLHYQLVRSCYLSKIFDRASYLPGQRPSGSGTVGAPSPAYGIRHTVAAELAVIYD
ncbi:MAG: hypothetical protein ACR2L2_16090 [Acidobacteriota bacterium]